MEKKRSVGPKGRATKTPKGKRRSQDSAAPPRAPRPEGSSRRFADGGPERPARAPRAEGSSRRLADGGPERPARAPRAEGSSRRLADGGPERPARAPRAQGSSRRFADGGPERPARAPRAQGSSRRFADMGPDRGATRPPRPEGREFQAHDELGIAPSDSLVWGKRSVLEFLRKGAALQRVFVTTDGAGLPREFFELAKEQAIPVVRSQKARLDALTGRGNHQGVVASLGQRNFDSWEDLRAAAENSQRSLLLVALDGVQDPGNFGAILRTAEGAGCHGVVVGASRSCPLSATVSKTSAGADAHLKIARVDKLERILESLADSGVQVVATRADAETPYFEVDWTRPSVLVLGAEGEGMNPNLLRRCSLQVRLPMLGKLESLNVSASAAAILYEAVRQRS